MATISDFVGKGLVFPIRLTAGGLPVISGGEELIRSSILMILSWPRRQRIFLSEFGSVIEALLEEPNDDLLKGLVEYFIIDSLRTWEKRIDILQVDLVRLAPEKLSVELTYKIKATGFEEVITFPFYKTINT